MGTERDALMDAAYTARERLIKKIDHALDEYDQWLEAVYSRDVGFHPELVGDAVPHATEADVLAALNCESGPHSTFPDYDSDIRTGF